MPYFFDSATAAAAEEYLTFNQSRKSYKLRHVFVYGSRNFLPVSIEILIGSEWRKVDQEYLAVFHQTFLLDLEIDDRFRIKFENLTAGDTYYALCLLQPVKPRAAQRMLWRFPAQ